MPRPPGAKQVWINGEVHQEIKVQAAKAGCDIQDVVNSVLKEHVEKTKNSAPSSGNEQEPALTS